MSPKDLSVSFKLFLVSVVTAFLPSMLSLGQISNLSVTDFGARGDAVQVLVTTVSNSAVITMESTNRFVDSDVGKVMLLSCVGDSTTPTNNQDLVAIILKVSNGTNATISGPTSATSNGVACTFGTQNAEAFQRCVDACRGTNTIVNIPAGHYLLISAPALDSNFIMQNGADARAAVTLQKGGAHFLGADREGTVLVGCGVWQLRGPYAYRGCIFACQGPVTNDAPLVFENLTMDGGASPGLTRNHYFPASIIDGGGWDPTHDAVIDIGTPPLHKTKIFQNCTFRNWRGEMLKSVSGGWDGFIEVTNCAFSDGNATAFNFTFTHTIEGCSFSNLVEAVEFYQGYCSNACFFRNNVVTNMAVACMAIVGALADRVQSPYNIVSNVFYMRDGQNGIQTAPAQNLNIVGNQFFGPGLPLPLGTAGYQGSTVNSNILIFGNNFVNIYGPIALEGAGENSVYNVSVISNSASYVGGTSHFAGGYGWGTNIVFKGNLITGFAYGLMSSSLLGQFFVDDLSNQFPVHQTGDNVGRTNVVSYAWGMRHSLDITATNSAVVLDDSHPGQIPAGAQLIIAHAGSRPARLFFNASMTGNSLDFKPGYQLACQWTNGVWRQVSLTLRPLPPTNFRATPLGNGP